MEKNIIISNNALNSMVNDIKSILNKARENAYASINQNILYSNWQIGRRIVEEEQNGKERADYGTQLLKALSQQLVSDIGKEYNTSVRDNNLSLKAL